MGRFAAGVEAAAAEPSWQLFIPNNRQNMPKAMGKQRALAYNRNGQIINS
jgi:hypothetical protein